MYSNDTSNNPDDCGGEALQGIGDGMRAMMVGRQARGGEVNTRDLALYYERFQGEMRDNKR